MRITRQQIIVFSILLLGLGLRLYRVTYPYLDHHSWRQSDTAAIARNLFRNGFNILKPEVDWTGSGPSKVELELQVTPFLTASLYAIWGVQDWAGRVVPILFGLGATVYLYLLAKRVAGEGVALFSAFVFAILPLSVFFTRVPMPESGATFFAIAAIYHFMSSTETTSSRQYSLAIFFTAMAFLTKLTNLLLLGPLIFIAARGWRRGELSLWRIAGFFGSTLAVAFAYYAYIHASADIKLIPYRLGSDKWGNAKTWFTPLFYQVIFVRMRSIVFTWLGLLLLVAGLVLPVRNRLFHVWFLSALAYVFLVATGNLVHSYYQMPLVAPGSFLIGLALDWAYTRRPTQSLVVVACGGLLYLAVTNLLPMYGMYAYPAYDAAMKLREVDRSGSLILYVPHRPDINPELLYYADRKGWIIWPRQVSVAAIERFRQKGAQYVVMPVPRRFGTELQTYVNGKIVWTGRTYLILKL